MQSGGGGRKREQQKRQKQTERGNEKREQILGRAMKSSDTRRVRQSIVALTAHLRIFFRTLVLTKISPSASILGQGHCLDAFKSTNKMKKLVRTPRILNIAVRNAAPGNSVFENFFLTSKQENFFRTANSFEFSAACGFN